jgi:hypothetical protein
MSHENFHFELTDKYNGPNIHIIDGIVVALVMSLKARLKQTIIIPSYYSSCMMWSYLSKQM